MIETLSRGPVPVSALARPFSMSLPSVMQHLGILEAAGLVRSEKLGRIRTCSIQTEKLNLAEQWISARRQEWEGRFDRLEQYLTAMTDGGDSDDPAG